MKIGIIGCGAIGSVLCKFIDKEMKHDRLVAICDIDREKAIKLSRSLRCRPAVKDINSLIKKSDLVVEAVHPSIVRQLMLKCIRYRKHLMVMSVGGIIKNMDLLRKLRARIFIPSGAICGIDGVKAAGIGRIDSVTITSTKSPKSLEGAPYIYNHNIELRNIRKKTVIFEGSALEAIEGFPKNINVSAILSLAGIGPEKTRVKIVVDPKIKRNIHEIEVIGSFGRLTTKTENVLSDLNPKTSHLAVLSACATLKRLSGYIKIGT